MGEEHDAYMRGLEARQAEDRRRLEHEIETIEGGKKKRKKAASADEGTWRAQAGSQQSGFDADDLDHQY